MLSSSLDREKTQAREKRKREIYQPKEREEVKRENKKCM